MNSKDFEATIGARLRRTGPNSAQVDYLDEDGVVRATRPASILEVRMWDAIVKEETK